MTYRVLGFRTGDCLLCGIPKRACFCGYCDNTRVNFTLPEVTPLPEPKKEAPTGWVCPRCQVVHSPTVERCECRTDPFHE